MKGQICSCISYYNLYSSGIDFFSSTLLHQVCERDRKKTGEIEEGHLYSMHEETTLGAPSQPAASAAAPSATAAAAASDEAKVFIEIFGLPAPKLVKLAPNVKFGRVLKQIGRAGRLFINGNHELAETDMPSNFDLPVGSKHLTRIVFEEAASPPIPAYAGNIAGGSSAVPSHQPTPRSGETQISAPSTLVPARVESYQPVHRPGTPPSDHRRKTSPPATATAVGSAGARSERFAMSGNSFSSMPSGGSNAPLAANRAATFSNPRGGSTPTSSPIRVGADRATHHSVLVEHETQTSRHPTPLHPQQQQQASSASHSGSAGNSQYLRVLDSKTPMQRAVEAQYHPNANAMRSNLVHTLDSSPQNETTSSSHISNVSRVAPSMNLSGPGRGVQRRPIPSNHAHGDTVVPHIPWPSEVSVTKEVAAGAPGLQGVSSGLYFNATPAISSRPSTAATAALTPAVTNAASKLAVNPYATYNSAAEGPAAAGKILPAATMTPSTQLSRLNVSPISHRTRDEHDHAQQHQQDNQVAHPRGGSADNSAVQHNHHHQHEPRVDENEAGELLRQQQQLNGVIGTLLLEIQNLKRNAEEERRQRMATEKQLNTVMKLVVQQQPAVAGAAGGFPEPHVGPAPIPVPFGGRSASATAATPSAMPESETRKLVEDNAVLDEHLKLMEELRGQRRAHTRPQSVAAKN